MRSSIFCAVLLSVAILAGCSRRAAEDEVAVVQAPPPPPASAWVMADSAAVADELVGEMLKRPWVSEFKERTGRVPKVALGAISDRSRGAVDLEVHRRELARALAAGGVVQVLGEPQGADFVLKGAVGSNDGVDGDVPVKRYQIDVALADAKTGDVATPTLSIEKQKDDRVAPPAPPAPAATPAPDAAKPGK
jgi:hypothetical protein